MSAQNTILLRLIVVNSILAAFPLAASGVLIFSNYPIVEDIFIAAAEFLYLTAPLSYLAVPLFYLAFPLTFLVLLRTAWLGVRAYGMKKMEAWWWTSVPYSVIFGLSFRVFGWDRLVVHTLAPFAFAFMMTTASAALWTVAAVLQAVRLKSFRIGEGKTTIAMWCGIAFLIIVLVALK